MGDLIRYARVNRASDALAAGHTTPIRHERIAAAYRALGMHEEAKEHEALAESARTRDAFNAKSSSEKASELRAQADVHEKAAMQHSDMRRAIRSVPGTDVEADAAMTFHTAMIESHWNQAQNLRAQASEWDEDKHPRDGKGRFT